MRASTHRPTDRLFNSVVGPSRLALQADYYMFKDGVRPSYEENPTGGVWTFNLEKGNKKRLEESWLHLVRGPFCRFL
jgi:translation initiation factor 4E